MHKIRIFRPLSRIIDVIDGNFSGYYVCELGRVGLGALTE